MTIKAAASLRQSRQTVLCLSVAVMFGVVLSFVTFFPHLMPTVARPGVTTTQNCPFPIVYNKPPKTASSYIQTVIANWTAKTNRGNYMCSTNPIVTSAILHECLPSAGDACGVFNCHIFMSPAARSLLSKRLPNYRTLTSTRYPPHRIVSYFLQINGFKVTNSPDFYKALRWYLSSYNPWRLYNYHTAEERSGSCPVSIEEMRLIFNLATSFDIVIDANLREESNAILKHFDLFQLPPVADADRNKERGAYRLALPDEMKDLLRNVSCVEIELHKALQVRMASLYQQATGETCVQHLPRHTLSSCIEEKEKEILKNNLIM